MCGLDFRKLRSMIKVKYRVLHDDVESLRAAQRLNESRLAEALQRLTNDNVYQDGIKWENLTIADEGISQRQLMFAGPYVLFPMVPIPVARVKWACGVFDLLEGYGRVISRNGDQNPIAEQTTVRRAKFDKPDYW